MEEKEILKVPPRDINAEEAILGCMLFDKEGLAKGIENINAEEFYKPNSKVLFEAMKALYNSNSPVDAITIGDKLNQMGVIEKIGGIEYLAKISNTVFTSSKIESYIEIVKNAYIRRRLIKISNEIEQASFRGEASVNQLIELAEKSIFSVVENIRSTEFADISDILVSAISKIELLANSKGAITGVPTGFMDLDKETSGFQKADLILLAARPSMGKTALALNIAQNMAIKYDKKVAIFSLEMSKEQLINRMICSEALIDSNKLRTGDLNSGDWKKLIESVPILSKASIYIDDTASISVTELRSKCRKLKIEKGLDIIFIDYLQLMVSGSRSENRQQEVSEISRTLKAIARELNVPVVALSQLSRGVESRQDKRPMLSDLRESGAIEQDADIVSFLYRDEYYNNDTEHKNIAELIIAKQRNGPTGTVKLTWLSKYTKFGDTEI